MKDSVADIGMWFQEPEATSTEGRERLKRNEILFCLADELSVDYAFEPNENNDFELIPASVGHQGIGITVNPLLGVLELDVYFFPCDYSEDSKRNLPPYFARVPVVSTSDTECVRKCVEHYFVLYKGSPIVTIPFSFSKIPILEGNFIDHFTTTSKICKNAIKDGTDHEIANCKKFLEFVKNVGLS